MKRQPLDVVGNFARESFQGEFAMAFLGLCQDDPLVTLLRDYFTATIVLVPEQCIRPLCALYYGDGRLVFRGDLFRLMKKLAALLNESLGTSQMACLTGKRSQSVQLSLGLKILGSYLGAFGVPSAALRGELEEAETISFEFHDVNRDFVDIGLLGKALADNELDLSNPANGPVVPNEEGAADAQLLAIDSVITSNKFTVCVQDSKSDDFVFDLPAIQDIVTQAGANVTVESYSERTVSFMGRTPVVIKNRFNSYKLQQVQCINGHL